MELVVTDIGVQLRIHREGNNIWQYLSINTTLTGVIGQVDLDWVMCRSRETLCVVTITEKNTTLL